MEQELKQTNQIHFLSILLFTGSNTSVFHISSLRYILDAMKSGLASSELIDWLMCSLLITLKVERYFWDP